MTVAQRMLMASSGRITLPPPLLTSQYQAGVVHTQHSADAFGNATAVAAAKVILADVADAENQHIMGFGTISPEPVDGSRDYAASGLDDRVDGVMAGADRKIITFALAPAWMREVPDGITPIDDFTPIEWYHAPPDAIYVDDFADLCADIANTYTDVDHFLVWNEMKGMFLDAEDRWDYERYLTLYEAVRTAVLAARPDAQIGGPYLNLATNTGTGSPVQSPEWGWLDVRIWDAFVYWLENKSDAEFICVDGGNYPAGGATAGEFGKYRDFMETVRALNPVTYPGADTLPIWIVEHYCYPVGSSTTSNSGDVSKYPAYWACGTMEAIRAGYATCLLWQPQGADDDADALAEPLGLWTDTENPGGGAQTALRPVMEAFHDHLSAGAPIYWPDVGNVNIDALGSATKCILANRAGTSQSTSGFTPSTTLTAYEVKVVDWSPIGYTPASEPSHGALWVDSFAATTNLRFLRGSGSITSGKLRGTSTSSPHMATYAGTYTSADHYSSAVVSTVTNASSEAGVAVRFDTATTSYYLGLIKSAGAVELYYFNGSTYTLITSGSVTLGTLPGTIRLEVEGTGTNNLKLYWRGSLAIQGTHATLTTGLPSTYIYPVGNVANVELDSWEADLL